MRIVKVPSKSSSKDKKLRSLIWKLNRLNGDLESLFDMLYLLYKDLDSLYREKRSP